MLVHGLQRARLTSLADIVYVRIEGAIGGVAGPKGPEGKIPLNLRRKVSLSLRESRFIVANITTLWG